ncbi:chorismate mutase [Niabella drilacis]|uniref:chorismate mutase n=1 Tax=Niabella drilacis (strain DSM 25811 / CCM 8410 / CCUG 62505 / LMG 26954 / E90) TaxID=1285928 RepID=A0A1G6SEM7_NIADE|nr:chorismate mutase [Niabella drilacis]SDD15380.1 isochorismate pyruvate lyase [Niabella drilacis]
MSPEYCNNIDDIRKEIDVIDEAIVRLIGRRAQFVKAAAKFKRTETAVRDEERVAAVIGSKKQLAIAHGVSPELIEAVYHTMIGHFVNEELEHWKTPDR